MKWFLRGTVLTLYVGVSVLAIGCGADNQKEAAITGKAPAVPQNYADQNKGGIKNAPGPGYPGASSVK